MADEKRASREAIAVVQEMYGLRPGGTPQPAALALDAHTDARIAAALRAQETAKAPGMASCGHGYGPGSPNCPQCNPTPESIAYLCNELTAEKAAHAATRTELGVIRKTTGEERIEFAEASRAMRKQIDGLAGELEATKAELTEERRKRSAIGGAHDAAEVLLRIERRNHEATSKELEAELAAHEKTRVSLAELQVAVADELKATKVTLGLTSKSLKDEIALVDRLKAELESLRKPLEGELAEDVKQLREFLNDCRGLPGLSIPDRVLSRIEAALRAKGPIDEHLEHGCAEAFVSLESRARAGERLAVHQTEWLAAEAARLRAKGEPQAAEPKCGQCGSDYIIGPAKAEPSEPELTEPELDALRGYAELVASVAPEPRPIISDDDFESLTSPLSVEDPPNDDLVGCANADCRKAQIHRGPCEPEPRPIAADAVPCRPPTKILMTDEWLRRRAVADRDVDTEAGAYPVEFHPCAGCLEPTQVHDGIGGRYCGDCLRKQEPAAPAQEPDCKHGKPGKSCYSCCYEGEPFDPAPELPRKVAPGTTLTVGARYRITEIASWDRHPPDHVGKEFTCDGSDHWRGIPTRQAWLVAEGTYVTGLELVADAPNGESK